MFKQKTMVVAIAAAISSSAGAIDFGQKVEALAKAQSLSLYGVAGTLGASSTTDLTAAQLEANPASAITVAPGLSVSVVSANAGTPTNPVPLGKAPDQIVLWPNDTNPTHIIECNEEVGPTVNGVSAGGLQRIRLSDGLVENIVASPMHSCDPVEITSWGTVVFGEENGTSGRMFELLDPIGTTNVTIPDGTAAATVTSDPVHVRAIPSLGQLSFEGISVYPNGVVYYSDENRPSATDNGGGYFKFIPTNLRNPNDPAINNLDNSPLFSGAVNGVTGRIFGMRLGRNGGSSDIGGGNHSGRGNWIEVVDGQVIGSTTVARANLRAAATALKLSTGYRPEDQDIDKGALALGKVRVCGTNTGQDTTDALTSGDNNFGETYCITDGTVATNGVIATTTLTVGGVAYTANNGVGTTIPEYHNLVEHFLDFGMPDNVAYQPGRGNWVINEDGDGSTYTPARNNDVWDCLDDGADKDNLSDGCVKVMTINDLTAETTGGTFDATGKNYYVSIQHNKTNHGIIVKVSGWQ